MRHGQKSALAWTVVVALLLSVVACSRRDTLIRKALFTTGGGLEAAMHCCETRDLDEVIRCDRGEVVDTGERDCDGYPFYEIHCRGEVFDFDVFGVSCEVENGKMYCFANQLGGRCFE